MKSPAPDTILHHRTIGSVLILRTARNEQLARCMSALRQAWPGCEFTVATRESTAQDVAAMPDTARVIPMSDGPVRVAEFPWLRVLKHGIFDLVVVLYNEPTGAEYLHVDITAALIPAKHRLIHDVEGNFRKAGSPVARAGRASEIGRRLGYAFYSRSLDKTLLAPAARLAALLRKIPSKALDSK